MYITMTFILVGLALLCFLFFRLTKTKKSKQNLVPLAKGSWPMVGHLPLLRGSKPAHVVLGDLADKHGPLYRITMGVRQVLVISSAEYAKQFFTTHDKVFASRPPSLFSKISAFDSTMIGVCPYGDLWRQLRRIATVDLLSNHRVQMFRQVRESEVRTALSEMYRFWGANKDAEIDMKRWLQDINFNIILKVILGKDVGYGGSEKEGELRQHFATFFKLGARFIVSDALPFLRWLDIGGEEAVMRSNKEELARLTKELLKEHRHVPAAERGTDYMDLFIDAVESSAIDLDGYDPDTIIVSNCLGFILAATHTTTASLSWALAMLVNHPEALEKAKQEIDSVVGRERLVSEEDIKDLGFLTAVVKESMRLYPGAPLSLPHMSTSECVVGGYEVPAGTLLFCNIWKIQRDPELWENPEVFDPERFRTTKRDVDVKGQDYELLPFGAGRRMCPGTSFSMHVVQLTLASLLQAFEFRTNGPVDLTEAYTIALTMAGPLSVFITPRLPPSLYGCS